MSISRRNFLKMGALGLSLGLMDRMRLSPEWLFKQQGVDLIDVWKTKYQNGAWLGRTVATVTLRKRPDADSAELGKKYQDSIVEILREVVGKGPRTDPHNHRWFETPEGFLWAPYVFPMEFQINQPLETIPNGKVWVEVSVPWVQGRTQPSVWAPVAELYGGVPATLYFASVYPATKATKDESGQIWYFLDELALPMYARAEGLRVISAEEVTPIHPDVEDKQIVVDLRPRIKTLSALENGKEIFFTYIACGNINEEEHKSATPPGEHPIWNKRIGVRMMGGNAATGFDSPGVGWSCIFSGHGEAIHSTYWHNDYGIPKSHGCVNARPQDAKWIFRWTQPVVEYPSGIWSMETDPQKSTVVKVLF